jgi:hypothetical protein
MVYELVPGDAIQIGEAVTLTVVAVEEDRVRFELASPEGECPDGPQVDAGWELN